MTGPLIARVYELGTKRHVYEGPPRLRSEMDEARSVPSGRADARRAARARRRGGGVGARRARSDRGRRGRDRASPAGGRGPRVHGEDFASLTRKHARNGLPASATSSRGRGHGHLGRSRCDKGHRVRQPEGRRREDDVHAQPRRRVHGAGAAGADGRPRPAGEPDDEPGAQSRHDRAVDVRRARPPPAHRAGAPRARSTSRSRRSTSRAPSSRCRA